MTQAAAARNMVPQTSQLSPQSLRNSAKNIRYAARKPSDCLDAKIPCHCPPCIQLWSTAISGISTTATIETTSGSSRPTDVVRAMSSMLRRVARRNAPMVVISRAVDLSTAASDQFDQKNDAIAQP
jgi:hypothetical protein